MSQYFDEDNNLKEEHNKINVKFNDKSYIFNTCAGVFSKERLDYGTRVLLESFLKDEISGNVLDLGCGYGAIGIILKKERPDLNIDMVDITSRSISLTRKNLKLNGVINNVFKSDIFESVVNIYDIIVTNPPIRVGKEKLMMFLTGTYDYLNDNGVLYFVMRKNHGVKSAIDILNDKFDIEIMDRSKGFYVIKATKKI